MPTYRVSMIVRNPKWATIDPFVPTREVTTHFAGCTDEMDARRKAKEIYDVELFKRVTLAEEK